MLSMYRFISRSSGSADLEPIVRYQAIDFPSTGPESATAAQIAALAKALEDVVAKEARFGQIVLATRATTGGIVAVENLNNRGKLENLIWLLR